MLENYLDIMKNQKIEVVFKTTAFEKCFQNNCIWKNDLVLFDGAKIKMLNLKIEVKAKFIGQAFQRQNITSITYTLTYFYFII